MCVQRRRSSQDDEIHYEVREKHSRENIHSSYSQFLDGRTFPLFNCTFPVRPIVFNFLRRLPEEKIGRDGRAEQANKGRKKRTRPFDAGHKGYSGPKKLDHDFESNPW
jgi:hypothetical protein